MKARCQQIKEQKLHLHLSSASYLRKHRARLQQGGPNWRVPALISPARHL
jgi:hypothetical protein